MNIERQIGIYFYYEYQEKLPENITSHTASLAKKFFNYFFKLIF